MANKFKLACTSNSGVYVLKEMTDEKSSCGLTQVKQEEQETLSDEGGLTHIKQEKQESLLDKDMNNWHVSVKEEITFEHEPASLMMT
ncbi:uncharacterized protein [Halyomorpha halys]|uniref:uncharacterized protein isoform X3 n=1 Tax=Halyomorpha halys TaxID=286706 RepID=UPI0034D1C0E0